MNQQRSVAFVIKNMRAVRSVFLLVLAVELGCAGIVTPAWAVTLSLTGNSIQPLEVFLVHA